MFFPNWLFCIDRPPAWLASTLIRNLGKYLVKRKIVPDGVFPASIAAVVYPGIGIWQDGEQVVIDLAKGQAVVGR